MSLETDVISQMIRIDSSRDPQEVLDEGISIMKEYSSIGCLGAFLRDIEPERTILLGKEDAKAAILSSKPDEFPVFENHSLTIVDGFGFVNLMPVKLVREDVAEVLALIYSAPQAGSGQEDAMFIACHLGMIFNPEGPGGEVDARGFIMPPAKCDLVFYDKQNKQFRVFEQGVLPEPMVPSLMRDIAQNLSAAFDQIAHMITKTDNEFLKDFKFHGLAKFEKKE